MEGNKKNINIVKALNRPEIPIGEFTIKDDPVVTVKKSKIPAEDADKNKDKRKKIAA
ncbi:hypothetical protein [Hyunsoonleella aestuarii]|uniref:Uncharacterized protein n=1 Tax=Hyunsoonleella aestuarii TaxID=912802 RepID=A0ABP8EED1_9FLAO|nr:hypothetical protein [Hyunsoonleella aestuarii]